MNKVCVNSKLTIVSLTVNLRPLSFENLACLFSHVCKTFYHKLKSIAYGKGTSDLVGVFQKWKDTRLSWSATEFDNLSLIYVKPTEMWTPDIGLYNK